MLRLSGVLLAKVDVAVLQRVFTGMLDDGVPEATTRRVYSSFMPQVFFCLGLWDQGGSGPAAGPAS
jgi:hypothetical protein